MVKKAFFILTGLSILVCRVNSQEEILFDKNQIRGVSVMGEIRLEIHPSDSVFLNTGNPSFANENLIIEIEEEILNIRFRTKTPRDESALLKLHCPELDFLEVRDEALIISADTLATEKISLLAASGGKMELKLRVEEIHAEVKQGAILVLYGSVFKQVIEASSGGSYSAYQLESIDSEVKSLMGGRAMVTTRRILNARAATRGFIGYKGSPVSVSVDAALGGEIVNYSEDPSE